MKGLVVLLAACLCSGAFAGPAPETLAGKVYRDWMSIASLRSGNEQTFVFGNDGRFIHLKNASRNFVSEGFTRGFLLRDPGTDGTYAYTRTGDDTATLQLYFDSGAASRVKEL